ncbi:hypothetical protein PIB30_111138, partial [Stylosanthes scabra]|nr:hypothetical protein [Stylosanthes scabra]
RLARFSFPPQGSFGLRFLSGGDLLEMIHLLFFGLSTVDKAGSVDGDGGDSAVNEGEKFGWWWMVRLFGWPKVVDGEVASAVLLGGCSELWWVWWRRTKVNSTVVEYGGSRVSDGRFGWLMDVWVR